MAKKTVQFTYTPEEIRNVIIKAPTFSKDTTIEFVVDNNKVLSEVKVVFSEEFPMELTLDR